MALSFLTCSIFHFLVVRGIVTAMLVAEEPILDWFSCSKLYTLLGLVLSTPRPASNPVELKQWIAEVEMVSALSHLIKVRDLQVHATYHTVL